MASITEFILQVLIQLHDLTGNLGWAIISFTLIVRSLLIPLTLPALKKARENQTKQKLVQKELKKLEKTHKKDPQKLQQARVDLYQKHNLNPLSGCLPQLVQLGLLIVLYRALLQILQNPDFAGTDLNTHFFWLDLTISDPKYVLPVVAGLGQFIFSLMVAPGAETPDIIPNDAKSKKLQKANEKEEDTADMAKAMQQQMIFVMPVMTAFLAFRFPAGLVLYWITTTVFSAVQQYFVSGFGGLTTYTSRAKAFVVSVRSK